MGDLASFKQKLEERLKEAEAQVEILRESLRMLNEEMNESSTRPPKTSTPKPPPKPLIASPSKASSNSLTRRIKDFILAIDGEFNNRGVAQAVLDSFPNLPEKANEKAMTNRVSNIVWKLKKEGLIEVTHHGVGSDPNTFKVVRPNEMDGKSIETEQ